MTRSPAFQFYPADFLSDANVVCMTTTEIGAYWLLLCYCWKEEGLPTDLKRLALLAKMSEAEFLPAWEKLKTCFVLDGEKFQNPRLKKERAKQKKYSSQQSNKAKSRWQKAKSEHAAALPVHMHMQCFSSSSSSSENKKEKLKRKSAVTTGWQITERLDRWATENQFTAAELQQEVPAFLEYHQAKGSRFVDWDAAFQTWMRNKRKWAKPETNPFDGVIWHGR